MQTFNLTAGRQCQNGQAMIESIVAIPILVAAFFGLIIILYIAAAKLFLAYHVQTASHCLLYGKLSEIDITKNCALKEKQKLITYLPWGEITTWQYKKSKEAASVLASVKILKMTIEEKSEIHLSEIQKADLPWF